MDSKAVEHRLRAYNDAAARGTLWDEARRQLRRLSISGREGTAYLTFARSLRIAACFEPVDLILKG